MAADCVATVCIYSGRPDPEWPLSASRVERLRRLWSGLGRERAAPASTPALGYRGIALRCAGGGEWRAYGGLVSHTADGSVEWRTDERRRFERALLATAPAGAVPAGIPEIDDLF